MGSDRGAGPATSGSPDYPAITKCQPAERQSDAPAQLAHRVAAAIDLTSRRLPAIELDACDEGQAEEIEIETVFQRKVSAARRLPRRDRSAAFRAARDWRQAALHAVREKRARVRHANRMLRQLRMPSPN